MFKKLSLTTTTCLLGLATGPALAIDGWDFSGSNARNQAMSSNYFNLYDSYNIWVNPAYVDKYKNRVDVNITDGFRDDESAGVFVEAGNTGTWGFYLGRPSDSRTGPADSPFSLSFGQPSSFTATNGGVTNLSPTTPSPQSIEQPRSVFDAFWGKDLGGVGDIGVRLNIQMLQDETVSSPTTTVTPNTFQATDIFRQTDTVNANSVDFDSSELNIALGWVSANGQWDASLIYGSPDASSSSALSDTRVTETLNGIDGTVLGIQTENFSGNQSISSDSANALGIALRGDIGGFLLSLGYTDESNGYNSTINGTTTFQNDNNNDGNLDVDISTNFSQTGTRKDEANDLRLFVSRLFAPSANSSVNTTLGWTQMSTKVGTVNTQRINSFTDNIAGTTTYAFNGDCPGFGSNPCFGTQTNSQTETDTVALPLIISAEAMVGGGFTVRGSVFKDLYLSEATETSIQTYALPTTPAAGDNLVITDQINVQNTRTKRTRVWDTDTTIAFGAGYTKDSIIIDAVILKEFVTQGVDSPLTSRINGTWLF